VGEPCGTVDAVGVNAAGDEISTGCRLTYEGMRTGHFVFMASAATYKRGDYPPGYGGYGNSRMFLDVMPDGTLSYLFYYPETRPHGTLHRVGDP
jgi:hypothetical protein